MFTRNGARDKCNFDMQLIANTMSEMYPGIVEEETDPYPSIYMEEKPQKAGKNRPPTYRTQVALKQRGVVKKIVLHGVEGEQTLQAIKRLAALCKHLEGNDAFYADLQAMFPTTWSVCLKTPKIGQDIATFLVDLMACTTEHRDKNPKGTKRKTKQAQERQGGGKRQRVGEHVDGLNEPISVRDVPLGQAIPNVESEPYDFVQVDVYLSPRECEECKWDPIEELTVSSFDFFDPIREIGDSDRMESLCLNTTEDDQQNEQTEASATKLSCGEPIEGEAESWMSWIDGMFFDLDQAIRNFPCSHPPRGDCRVAQKPEEAWVDERYDCCILPQIPECELTA